MASQRCSTSDEFSSGSHDHSSISFVGYFKKIFILREHRKTRRLARYVFLCLAAACDESEFANPKISVTGAKAMQMGMIGLGRMGANMVRRLLKGSHQCVVFDTSPNAVRELTEE